MAPGCRGYYMAPMDEWDLTPKAILIALSAASLLLAVAAAIADHRRRKRRDLDRVGWMPWDLVQIVAFLAALAAAGIALQL